MPWFSGDGVGLLDETWVMVGETGGEACAGPGRERERCIWIIAPSSRRLAEISSLPAARCQYEQRARSSQVRVLEVPTIRRRGEDHSLSSTAREATDKRGRSAPR